ncbi:hypothetical protein [Streptomyces spiralis]|uniref:hypothetical protein n=1 Tax=Streptomyces spiralis TaxID=66376 RepID=UPI0033D613FC
MSTDYSACPTCGTQLATVRCDNCRNVIPNDTAPAVTGRVWIPDEETFRLITLCSNCENLPLQLVTVVKGVEPADSQPALP